MSIVPATAPKTPCYTVAMRTSILALSLAVIGACAPAPSDDPGLILTGGTIYPLGASDDPVAALAIRGATLLAVGSDEEIFQLAGRYTQQMNLESSVVLPGTYDAWIDLEALGRWESVALDVRLASSVAEVQAMVRNAAGTASADRWVIGWGWDENNWPTAVLPDRTMLDTVTAERPLVLLHRNGQSAWLNSAGLASLPSATLASSAPGTVMRGPGGEPTGIIAGPALAALTDVLAGTPAERSAWLGDGGRYVASRGITRVASAPVDAVTADALLTLESQGLLPLRVDVRLTPQAASAYPGSELERRINESRLVAVSAVGLRLDGPLAARLASVAAPYQDGAAAGLPIDEDAIRAAVSASANAGLPLHVQASGDNAVGAAVAAIAATNVPGGMVIGFDLLPEEGADGAAGLGVAIAAARFADDIYRLDALLGPARARRAHAWSDLAAAGASLSFASDAPAYELRPLASMAAVLTRQDAGGYPAGGWNPSQTVPQTRIVRALVGAPMADVAVLVAGGAADLVVWSEDPLTAEPAALRRAEALLTIVAGRVAYSRPLVDLPMSAAGSR